MPRILHIETSSPICSVALSENGQVLALRETAEEKSHAAQLAVFIDQILNELALSAHQLDAIAVSEGPGSYTGLRIGASTAKGLAYGAGKPLIAVGTLQAMLQGIQTDHSQQAAMAQRLAPMIDARRMEVYTLLADLQHQIMLPIAPLVVQPDTWAELLETQRILFFGSGAAKCKSVITSPNALFCDTFAISARHMVPLAEAAFAAANFVDVAYFEPFYLKEFLATVPKNTVLGSKPL